MNLIQEQTKRLVMDHMQADDAGATLIGQKMVAVYRSVFSQSIIKSETTDIFPVVGVGAVGASQVEVRQLDGYGGAKIINSTSTDLPNVELGMKETRQPVVQLGNYFQFTTQELRAAAFAGQDLGTDKARAATLAHVTLMDNLFWDGDATAGVIGIRQVAFPRMQVANDGTGNSTSWTKKSPEQILRDLRIIADQVSIQSGTVRNATHIILSAQAYNAAAGAMFAGAGGLSALGAFMRDQESLAGGKVQIIKSRRLGATGNVHAIVLDKIPDVIGAWVPMLAQAAPQRWQALAIQTPMESLIGGAVSADLRGAAIVEGVI